MNDGEIIKALKCCSRIDAQCKGCDDCQFEYCGPECDALCHNAADLIESLKAQLTESQRRERAEVENLRASKACLCCKNNGTGLCKDCDIFASNFEWRGPQEAGEEHHDK